ncbi:MAG: RNA polymerase factor sigma-54 [Flavobacteriaceae bacterium]|nr:RNA polymerase factor sigma-54 [Flavobacteriaceae bacterium]MDC1459539.1 RNA polymerase factor sigma-54 [Flavobacteriaceae bacterium]MDG1032061.1 RNA polymerase factor sigma-54 [Flavobacteriaceae bacterium]MDG1343997.1 RNA polymerase factor sigma-54 [Flavobacteriaceae bacterium]MDG2485668.1 RNA polymerase factor sigma-54 [Flavobacteriaceae bacterium]
MLKQFLQLKLSQKLSPQQIQLMKLIELPLQELEDRLSREIEENPALETGKENEEDLYDNESDYEQETKNDDSDLNVEDYLSDDDVPDYKLKTNNYSDDDEEKSLPFISGISFNQFLKNQLTPFSLNENDSKIAEFLVGSVDQSGYIRTDLIDIVDDLAFTMGIYTDIDSVTKILNKIHLLDPPGVGARDLKECLILQLKRKKESSSATNAVNILTNHFDLFIKKHYKKIIHKLSISEDELREAIKQIEKLNPKPGSAFSEPTKINSTIIPDFKIEIIDNKLSLNLNSRNAPELFVSNEYKNMLSGYQENKNISKSQKQAVTFIKQKLDSAKWFIDAINQRNQTLLITMKTIMEFQNKYFLSGDESNLKPMILKDIAEKIGMDISTISRVANSKYVDTPYGIKLIKSFFSEGITNDKGVEVSTIEIKKELQSIINNENKSKPLTDDELTKRINKKGYPIARRTVAKYREMIGAPVARLRKKL